MAVIVCPACNKANQTGDACQRCGCDLTQLHEIAAAAVTRLGAARTALAGRDWSTAVMEAERSWRLLHTGESAQLAFLAAAARGDGTLALRWRERAAARLR
jgi:hypothetical protein